MGWCGQIGAEGVTGAGWVLAGFVRLLRVLAGSVPKILVLMLMSAPAPARLFEELRSLVIRLD